VFKMHKIGSNQRIHIYRATMYMPRNATSFIILHDILGMVKIDFNSMALILSKVHSYPEICLWDSDMVRHFPDSLKIWFIYSSSMMYCKIIVCPFQMNITF